MRSVREDLIPAFKNHGLHVIIDLNDSPIRKMIPEGVEVENASLAELKAGGHVEMMNRAQIWRRSGQSTVVFLKLDTCSEEKLVPPETTPARTLKSLLPVVLQEAADSICYVAKEDLVLAIKHKWLPADVYAL